jgi:hypothetical protein
MIHRLRLLLAGRVPSFAKEGYLRLRQLNAGARALPDFLIIGAQKAGTTSLHNYLCMHPQVIGSLPKEVFYFCSHPERGERWYRRHFPTRRLLARRGAICGEATPTSLYSAQAAELAARCVPRARIIALLREPAARAVSHYYHQVRFGRETRAIDTVFSREAIDQWEAGGCPDLPWRWYFKWSDYATGLQYWRQSFPKEQLLVLKAEDLFADPQAAVDQVCAFLGLEPIPLGSPRRFNAGQPRAAQPRAFPELRHALNRQCTQLRELGVGFDWGGLGNFHQ